MKERKRERQRDGESGTVRVWAKRGIQHHQHRGSVSPVKALGNSGRKSVICSQNGMIRLILVGID